MRVRVRMAAEQTTVREDVMAVLAPGRAAAGEAGAGAAAGAAAGAQVGHEHAPMRAGRPNGDRGAGMTDDDSRDRAAQIQRTMELLVHATSCQVLNCEWSNCTKVKHLFKHAMACQLKAGGGCQLCRKMWTLLQVHSKGCETANCPVPRCRDLKDYYRRAQREVAVHAEARERLTAMLAEATERWEETYALTSQICLNH